jgi:hypothetical protein
MEARCAHHWILGDPDEGLIEAGCRKCGARRTSPVVLDDIYPGIAAEERRLSGVATAVGGVRPSSVAALSSGSRS